MFWSVLFLACTFLSCGALESGQAPAYSIPEPHTGAGHCQGHDLPGGLTSPHCGQDLSRALGHSQTDSSALGSQVILPLFLALATLAALRGTVQHVPRRPVPVATPLPPTLRFHRYTI